MLTWVYPAIVFVADFALTRGFASGMRMENARTRASVHIAEQIAVALMTFDLSRARVHLDADSSEHLPPGLYNALSQLLENLHKYKLPNRRGHRYRGCGGVGGKEDTEGTVWVLNINMKSWDV